MRNIIVIIVILILLIVIYPVIKNTNMESHASTTRQQLDEAEKRRAETRDKLEKTEDNLDNLNVQKDTYEGELNKLNNKLSDVSNNLSKLEEEIVDKNIEIEDTKVKLDEALRIEHEQYEAMKVRIKYMYEKSDSTYIDALFSSNGLGEVLNREFYFQKLAEYDRKMLDEYEANRIIVEENKKSLEEEESQLQALKVEVEAEKKKVSGYVSETASVVKAYKGEISQAEAEALAYEDQIKAEEQNIATLRKKLEEELAMARLAAASSWRNISDVEFAEGDRYLMANLIYCEAGGEPYEGQLAVGAVVINRLLSSVYPNTVVGVIYQNRQFSPVASGRLALALAENRATGSCYSATDAAMSGGTNVGTALYFRTPIEGLTGINIGGHIFY